MDITITIPDDVADRVLTAVAAVYKYDANSGLSQQDFITNRLLLMLQGVTANYEAKAAQDTAVNELSTSFVSAKVLKTPLDNKKAASADMVTAIPDSKKPL